MRSWIWLGLLGCLVPAATAWGQQPVAMRVQAPEFTDISAWINSTPLKLADLQGKVVVLHFWAFG